MAISMMGVTIMDYLEEEPKLRKNIRDDLIEYLLVAGPDANDKWICPQFGHFRQLSGLYRGDYMKEFICQHPDFCEWYQSICEDVLTLFNLV